MKINKNKILLIGGATRNVGKTSFTCSVIQNLSKDYTLVGLKIKTIYENDDFFHGKDRNPLKGNYSIIEELDKNGKEDSMKMLYAGAKKVYRIKSKMEYLDQAFKSFLDNIPAHSFIICESNSLREIIQPALFLMIKHKDSDEMKPSAKKLEVFADKFIHTDGLIHDFDTKNIFIANDTWKLKK